MQTCIQTLYLAIGMAVILAAGAGFGSAQKTAIKPETLETRLQRLEDREQIRQLLMDYGRFLDQRDFAAFSRLFAEKEGEWIGGMGKAKGPEAIRKLMEDTIGKDAGIKNTSNFHVFTNDSIRVDGDKATAVTKWFFVVKGENDRPQLVYLGHYDDSFVRENAGWKFLRRVVHSDIPTDNQPSQKK